MFRKDQVKYGNFNWSRRNVCYLLDTTTTIITLPISYPWDDLLVVIACLTRTWKWDECTTALLMRRHPVQWLKTNKRLSRHRWTLICPTLVKPLLIVRCSWIPIPGRTLTPIPVVSDSHLRNERSLGYYYQRSAWICIQRLRTWWCTMIASYPFSMCVCVVTCAYMFDSLRETADLFDSGRRRW